MNLEDVGKLLNQQQSSMDQQGPSANGQVPTDPCGPEPPRPNYFSPQAVRDRHFSWEMCKKGGVQGDQYGDS